jgi:hypothetical protein
MTGLLLQEKFSLRLVASWPRSNLGSDYVNSAFSHFLKRARARVCAHVNLIVVDLRAGAIIGFSSSTFKAEFHYRSFLTALRFAFVYNGAILSH